MGALGGRPLCPPRGRPCPNPSLASLSFSLSHQPAPTSPRRTRPKVEARRSASQRPETRAAAGGSRRSTSPRHEVPQIDATGSAPPPSPPQGVVSAVAEVANGFAPPAPRHEVPQIQPRTPLAGKAAPRGWPSLPLRATLILMEEHTDRGSRAIHGHSTFPLILTRFLKQSR